MSLAFFVSASEREFSFQSCEWSRGKGGGAWGVLICCLPLSRFANGHRNFLWHEIQQSFAEEDGGEGWGRETDKQEKYGLRVLARNQHEQDLETDKDNFYARNLTCRASSSLSMAHTLASVSFQPTRSGPSTIHVSERENCCT